MTPSCEGRIIAETRSGSSLYQDSGRVACPQYHSTQKEAERFTVEEKHESHVNTYLSVYHRQR